MDGRRQSGAAGLAPPPWRIDQRYASADGHLTAARLVDRDGRSWFTCLPEPHRPRPGTCTACRAGR
eukprot:3642415-Alexandrium_andersonii.AAC.1